MRVALSTSAIQRGKSGVGQYVLALVRALLQCAGDHRLVLFVLGGCAAIPVRGGSRRDRDGAGTAPARAEEHPVASRRLPGWLRRQRIHVLHVPSYRRLLFRSHCPRVATIHNLAPFHVRAKYDAARMFYGRVVVKRLARRQHKIITISQHTARDVERFFDIPLRRQHVIYNGIDHARFHPGHREQAAAAVAARFHLDAPFFLFVSRLEHPAKNHVRLIQAFNQFKARTRSPWLLALGGSDWHGVEFIRAAAAESPFAQDIRFLGFVDDPSLPDLYRAAETMVYPSLFEGFGFPPIEAMACGCPVISSNARRTGGGRGRRGPNG